MKNDKEKTENKFFKKGDMLIYALVLLILIASFMPLVFKDSKSVEKITVNDLNSGETVFSYDFSSQRSSFDGNKVKVTDNGEYLEVEITAGGGYNLLIVEKNGVAYMKEADCSFNADCVHSGKITRSGDVIICLPHKLEVIGMGSGEGEIIIG